MITLTANQQIAIAAAVRKPRWLVEIIFDGNTIRLTTGSTITWDSHSWVQTGIAVSDIKTGEGGIQTCRLNVLDVGSVYTLLLLTAGFVYKSVRIWSVYGEPPYDVADPVLKFTGEIISVPSIGPDIAFDCATRNGATRRSPAVTLGPPYVKHLPFPGQKVVIGNELYIVDIS